MFNKNNLAQEVFNAGEVQSVTAAERVIDTVLSSITKALLTHDKVSLAGFGIFRVKDMKAKLARNPSTGAKVKVGAYKKVKFTSALALKNFVNAKKK